MLSGRYPNHISNAQAPTCSNYLPLEFTLLSQKLAQAKYSSHFVGKGHLGWNTDDHLLINRGFDSHVGYLGGAETYSHGGGDADPGKGRHDFWSDGERGRPQATSLTGLRFHTERRCVSVPARHVVPESVLADKTEGLTGQAAAEALKDHVMKHGTVRPNADIPFEKRRLLSEARP